MTIRADRITIDLTEIVEYCLDESERLREEATEIRENYDHDWEDAPSELQSSEYQRRSEAQRLEEIAEEVTSSIEEHYATIEDGEIVEIESSEMIFKEISLGDGVDMSLDVSLPEDPTDEQRKMAERRGMAQYLNKMVVDTPSEMPDDMTELPLELGEGIFQLLDHRLTEGDQNLSASQIRQHTKKNSKN